MSTTSITQSEAVAEIERRSAKKGSKRNLKFTSKEATQASGADLAKAAAGKAAPKVTKAAARKEILRRETPKGLREAGDKITCGPAFELSTEALRKLAA